MVIWCKIKVTPSDYHLFRSLLDFMNGKNCNNDNRTCCIFLQLKISFMGVECDIVRKMRKCHLKKIHNSLLKKNLQLLSCLSNTLDVYLCNVIGIMAEYFTKYCVCILNIQFLYQCPHFNVTHLLILSTTEICFFLLTAAV